VPMVAGLIAAVVIAKLGHRRLGGLQLDEMPETASPKAGSADASL
jgi:hypothetical protein